MNIQHEYFDDDNDDFILPDPGLGKKSVGQVFVFGTGLSLQSEGRGEPRL